MSFSSRRRNYLLTPHRRDGLIEWMKSMLQHSFVLDALETTGADTFTHFEVLIEEHRQFTAKEQSGQHDHQPSRLKQLVPSIGVFHTPLPLRAAFEVYNTKHKLTKRKHIQISFNEIRHILNLAQIMAMRKRTDRDDVSIIAAATPDDVSTLAASMSKILHPPSPTSTKSIILHTPGSSTNPPHTPPPPPVDVASAASAAAAAADSIMDGHESSEDETESALTTPGTTAVTNNNNNNKDGSGNDELTLPSKLNGPKLISFDGDQTLYSDGENFEKNPRLANYLYLLLRHGVTVAVVTAAGYEYKVEKYEFRLSGLLHYFKTRGLTDDECERFYLFGGECNYLLQLRSDYRLHPVREDGPGGWMTSTRYLKEGPGNWAESDVQLMLDTAEAQVAKCVEELNLRGRAIRKRRSVGLVPIEGREIPRESLDEVVLRIREVMQKLNNGRGASLPFCSFNGGSDVWLDIGNKRVGVQVLQSYLGIPPVETLHIGDQFLNTGNDYAARDVSPCIWIINPHETTYILKSILRLSAINVRLPTHAEAHAGKNQRNNGTAIAPPQLSENKSAIDFQDMDRRMQAAKQMDVYTGEMK